MSAPDPTTPARPKARRTEPGDPTRVRVMVVEDHPMVRQALERSLAELDLEVVASCAEGFEALERYASCRPDVVVSDDRLPQMRGVEVARRLVAHHPQARVVIFSAYADAAEISAALDDGVRGWVSKNAPPEELADSIRRAAAGERAFDATTAAVLVDHLRVGDEECGRPSDLSDREVEVLTAAAAGKPNVAIAHELGVSERTVKTYFHRVYTKLGVNDRTRAVAEALRTGVIS